MPLVEQVCRAEGAELERKNLLISMLYLLSTFRRPPVIVINGRVVSAGRVPAVAQLRQWLEESRGKQ
ncbi:MAG: thioredoxin family protein [Chloroflexi bacterium]|nr:thioredoxin family protein [Chloroflexota bacterium]